MKSRVIATSRNRLTLNLVCWTFVLLLPCMAAAQVGQITFPENGSIVSGKTLLSFQVSDWYDPADVVAVYFQYSQDGANWSGISVVDTLAGGTASHYPGDWEAYWDTAQVPSGKYYLRAVVALTSGETLLTPLSWIRVNLPPIADAQGSIDSDYVARLFGTNSKDPDGYIVSYVWDFGDGSAQGYGSIVSHDYLPGQVYTVTLTVTDNLGAWSTDTLSVDTTSLTVAKDDSCIPTSIEVAKDGNVIGDDGKGAGWPKVYGFDGKKLGRIENQNDYWGYAFEVRVKVDGNPNKCVEIQLIRATYVGAKGKVTDEECKGLGGDLKDGVCTSYSRWTGATNDFDLDKTIDLDVSTKPLCTKFRGTWDPADEWCKEAVFPVDAKRYQPDESYEDSSAYRKVYTHKTHPGQMILWLDPPEAKNKGIYEGVSVTLNFVDIIKGTDSNCGPNQKMTCYCYADHTVVYVAGRAGSGDLTVHKNPCGVDKSQVPGLK